MFDDHPNRKGIPRSDFWHVKQSAQSRDGDFIILLAFGESHKRCRRPKPVGFSQRSVPFALVGFETNEHVSLKDLVGREVRVLYP
jgi:hypothetical protein